MELRHRQTHTHHTPYSSPSHLQQNPNLNLSLGFNRPTNHASTSQVRKTTTPSSTVVLNSSGQPILAGTSAFRPYLSPSERNPRCQPVKSKSVRVDLCQNPPPYDDPRYNPKAPRFATNPNPQPARRSRIEKHVIEDVQESTQNAEALRTAQKSTDRKRKEKITGLSDNLIAQLDVVIAYLRKSHDENVRWLRYEKCRDDLIRTILAKDHPELSKRLPPFPIDLLWMTPEQHPTLNE